MISEWKFCKKGLPLKNEGKVCCNPVEVINESSEVLVVRCNSTRERMCLFCAGIHRKNLRTVVSSGLPWLDSDKPLWTSFVTITAPGVDRLPWAKELCVVMSDHVCSGNLGCRSDPWSTALWNLETKTTWNHFVTELERELGIDVPYWKSWELQKRGALHLHALMRHEGISKADFEVAVREIASVWGFGEQIVIKAVTQANRAEFGVYVTVYVTKGSDLGLTFNELTGELKQGGYRPWSASRDWGLSMADVKLTVRVRAIAWAVASRGEVVTAQAGELDLASAPLEILFEKLRN